VFCAPRRVVAGRDHTPAAAQRGLEALGHPRSHLLDRFVVRRRSAGRRQRQRCVASLERAAVVTPIAQTPSSEDADPEGTGDGHGGEQAWDGEDHWAWACRGLCAGCERTPGTTVHTEAGRSCHHTTVSRRRLALTVRAQRRYKPRGVAPGSPAGPRPPAST